MRLLCLAIVLVTMVPAAAAKDSPKSIKIQVVTSQASQRQYAYTLPGTQSTSATNCNGTASGTTIGDNTTVNGTTNCTTTTTPGSPPRTVVNRIAQEHVYAIMPDDSHVTLWCQAGFRHCFYLQPGFYTAEVKGNSLFILAHNLSGKEFKVKYHAVGGW